MSSKNAIHKRNVHTDCWNLDKSFIVWLNEHLKVYYHDCNNVIDLSYHKITYEGKEYSQEEVIHMLIQWTEEALVMDTWDKNYEPQLLKITTLFGIILPAMWW